VYTEYFEGTELHNIFRHALVPYKMRSLALVVRLSAFELRQLNPIPQ